MYSAILDSTGLSFHDQDLVDVFQQRAGQDITTALDTVLNATNETYRAWHPACLTNVFLAGEVSSLELFPHHHFRYLDIFDPDKMCVSFLSDSSELLLTLDFLRSVGRSPARFETDP